ncbi:MAG: flagellar basal body-associated FliL family protein [Hyphomicrobium sp.]|jgi:flagellar FliL protein
MASDGKPKAKSGGGGIVGLLVVTLLAAGGGSGFGFFLHNQLVAANANRPPEAPKAADEHTAIPVLSKLVPLDPIVANLAAPADAWMRIEATMVVENMEKGAEKLASKVGEDIAAYLKTTTLAQFEGPSGFQNLREDLLDRAKIRDGVHIKDLVIHGIVVE